MTITDLRTDQTTSETQTPPVGAHPLDVSHRSTESHGPNADVHSLAADQTSCDVQCHPVGGDTSSTCPANEEPTDHPGAAGWVELRSVADAKEDIERVRRATRSRMGALQRAGAIDIEHDPFFGPYAASLDAAEKVVDKALIATFKRVVPPVIQEWVGTTPQLGIPSMARFLGHLGHPYVATPHHWEPNVDKVKVNGKVPTRILVADEPYLRTVSQLWQYCGVGSRELQLRKGKSAEELAASGRKDLRTLLWNVSQRHVFGRTTKPSMYSEIYVLAKERYADRVDAESGKPWPKARQDAAAYRLVGKEILRDLWLFAKADYDAQFCPTTEFGAKPTGCPSSGISLPTGRTPTGPQIAGAGGDDSQVAS